MSNSIKMHKKVQKYNINFSNHCNSDSWNLILMQNSYFSSQKSQNMQLKPNINPEFNNIKIRNHFQRFKCLYLFKSQVLEFSSKDWNKIRERVWVKESGAEGWEWKEGKLFFSFSLCCGFCWFKCLIEESKENKIEGGGTERSSEGPVWGFPLGKVFDFGFVVTYVCVCIIYIYI